MPAEKTDAIVLRSFPWSETSVIASLYTRDFGKLSVLAKGARRPKSPFEAALDLLSISRVVFISKSGDALDILTEARLLRRFRAGSRDLLRLYAGYYVAELLERLLGKGETHPEIFELSLATLSALADDTLEVRAIVLRFELQLLRCVGQLFSLRRCAQCGLDSDQVTDAESKIGKQWLAFGLVASGVLCDKCQPGASQLLRLPLAARDCLELFSATQWLEIDLSNYPTMHRAVLRSLMVKYLTIVLDRKWNLHPYLQELGR